MSRDPQLRLTATRIAEMQLPSGGIPWERGRHLDPWDHVEAAMGLDAFGDHSAAERAYLWLERMQAPDGGWAAGYRNEVAIDRTMDSNFCAYVAVGVWHHYLATSDDDFLERMWPVVSKALDLVIEMQMPSGGIRWARDAEYRAWPGALLTSSSCIFLALRCAITIAKQVRQERPDWELSLARLQAAIEDGTTFEPKDRFAMDWYYPVLTGVLRGELGRRRLEDRWDAFVIPGSGARCVSDRDWVTIGETSELAIACWRVGLESAATDLLAWTERLRSSNGLYWTGANHPSGEIYPVEATSWSAGAVLLATDAITSRGSTAALFSGESLVPIDLLEIDGSGSRPIR